jgi:hypothetical protein
MSRASGLPTGSQHAELAAGSAPYGTQGTRGELVKRWRSCLQWVPGTLAMCLGIVTFLPVPCSLRAAAPRKQIADSEPAPDLKKNHKDSRMLSCDLPAFSRLCFSFDPSLIDVRVMDSAPWMPQQKNRTPKSRLMRPSVMPGESPNQESSRTDETFTHWRSPIV